MNNPYHLKPEKTEEISIEGGSVLLNSGGSPVLLEAEFKRSIWHPGEAWIEISSGSVSYGRQYIGKPVKDKCYIDLSNIAAPGELRLATGGITLQKNARLLYFRQQKKEGKTLILAPHPDDGELECQFSDRVLDAQVLHDASEVKVDNGKMILPKDKPKQSLVVVEASIRR